MTGLYARTQAWLDRRSTFPKDSEDYWRQRILHAIILLGILAGSVVFVPSIIFLAQKGETALALIDTGVYASVLIMAANRRLGFKVRAWFVIWVLYGLGLMLYLRLGPYSGGPVWLFTHPVIAGVLLGTRAAVLAMGLNILTFAGLALLIALGGPLPWLPELKGELLRWVVYSVNFLLIDAVATLAAAYLVKALAANGRRLETALEGLKEQMTRRQEAENRLEASKGRLGKIIRESQAGYFFIDREGVLREVNSAWLAMHGYDDPAEILGRHFSLTQLDQDQQAATEMVETLLRGQSIPPGTFSRRRKDGSAGYHSFTASPVVVDGEVVGLEGFLIDTTEKKLYELALSESEEKYRSLYNSMTDLSVLHEMVSGPSIEAVDYRIIDCNQAFSQATGISRERAVGNLASQVYGCTPPPYLEIYARTAQTGQPQSFEAFYEPMGKHFHISVFSPAPGRFATIATDITQRKVAEEALRAGEERFRAIFEHAGAGIVISDLDASFHLANKRLCDFLGYSIEELMQLRVPDISHPEDAGLDPPQLQRLIDGEIVRHSRTKRYIRKDGSQVWGHLTVSLVRDANGRPQYFVAVVEDMTERMQAEQEQKANLLRQRLAMDLARLVHWEYDVLSNLFTFNDQFYALYGTTAAEQGGNQMPSQEYARRFLHADDIEMVRDEVNGAITTTDPNYFRQLEHRIIRADGQERFISVRFAVVKDAQGRTVRTYGANQDITEAKQAEAEKERLESQLRHSQKMEAIGTLAGGIAHDFNNILSAVLGFAEMAREDAQTGKVNTADLDQIMAAAWRAKGLIQQILDFSRKKAPVLKACDPNRIVEANKVMLERTLPKMIAIVYRLAPKLPAINADPTQLEQVLINLASNAADAMPEGGKLTLATRPVDLDEEFCRQHPEVNPGRYVQLTVSDSGQGMSQSTLEHIFEPFFTTKEVGRGTGLGLSSVFGIVRSHGGHILCQSQLGQGTTFDIYLPVPREESASAQSPDQGAPEADGPQGGETILLVDDEENLRLLGARALTAKGFTVLTAVTGEEAIAIYRERGAEVDLVIMDLGMPGMGGHRALKDLLALNPAVRVLIASGYAADRQVQESLDAGAAGYVAKPFRRQELLASVREALGRT